MTLSWKELDVGTTLPPLEYEIKRADLVRYAGASGDFNPIHWNQRIAESVGLPNVIAHGMFTMAKAIQVVTNWVGNPAAVVDYSVRFSRPVVVPDDDLGARLVVDGRIVEKLPDNQIRVDIIATSDGQKVLGMARAIVQLP